MTPIYMDTDKQPAIYSEHQKVRISKSVKIPALYIAHSEGNVFYQQKVE